MTYIDKFLKKNRYEVVNENENITILFDGWMEQYPNYNIHCVKGSKSDILTINDSKGENYHIIWDVSFWDIFEKYIYIIDEDNFSPQLDVNILMEDSGYMLGLFLEYLSKRYNYYHSFSYKLRECAQNFGYQILVDNFFRNEERINYEKHIFLCKQFVFWHEVAHVEFHKFDSKNNLYQKHIDLIYDTLSALSSDLLDEAEVYCKGIKKKIIKRKVASDLVEELAADLRALQRMLQYDTISHVKENLSILLQSVISLIDFNMIKHAVDKRWDYFVANKPENSSDLNEMYTLRRFIFPMVVFTQIGEDELGDSFQFDILGREENTDLLTRALDIINSEWFVKMMLQQEFAVINFDMYQEYGLLYEIYSYMSELNVELSSKRLKYLFNIAYTAQHSDCPLDSIPLYFDFIELALKKNNESIRHVGDAYARIARVYAENNSVEKAEIILNNAVEISKKLSNKDICEAFLYNNIGNAFQMIGNVDSAYQFYLKSLKIRTDFGDIGSMEVAFIYKNLGFSLYLKEAYPQSLKYYLKAYRILSIRHDVSNRELKDIKEEMKQFLRISTDVKEYHYPIKSSLSKLKDSYEKDANLLKAYLCGIVREFSEVSFGTACNLYIELVELVESHINDTSLYIILIYAFEKFKYSLKIELKIWNNDCK